MKHEIPYIKYNRQFIWMTLKQVKKELRYLHLRMNQTQIIWEPILFFNIHPFLLDPESTRHYLLTINIKLNINMKSYWLQVSASKLLGD